MATVIDKAGYTISTPGDYVLSANLFYGSSAGAAILITCDNVRINLAGHTITGNSRDNSAAYGIRSDNHTNIDISNGTISGFFYGISLNDNSAGLGEGGHDIRNVTVLDSSFRGILVSGDDCSVIGCTITGVKGTTNYANAFAAGIELFGDNGLVRSNVIREIHPTGTGEGLGISISSNSLGTIVSDNIITNNANDGHSSYGVWIGGDSDVLLQRNLIVNYANGFAYSSPPDGVFQSNTIKGWTDRPFIANSTHALDGGNNAIHLTSGNDSFVVGRYFAGPAHIGAGFFLYGLAGNDQITGDDGDDTFYGGTGADHIDGGSGVDTVAFDEAVYGGFTVSLTDNTLNTGVALGDTYTSIENLILSLGGDLAYGNSAANVISGRNGNDEIYGLGNNDGLFGETGNDTLVGGEGADRLAGGYGADHLDGGNGIDTAAFDEQAYGSFTISLTDNSLNTGVALGDTYTSIENLILARGHDVAFGDVGVNVINGRDGNDRLFGMDNDDQLFGEAGHDILFGGNGADRLDGGGGFDYAAYDDASYASFRVSLTSASLNTGVALGDTFVAIEGLILSTGDDVAYGNSLSNYIYGRGGNDTISGYAGNDFLFGEAGADNFMFNTRPGPTNKDFIGDFVSGLDEIGLAQLYFGAAMDMFGDVRLFQGAGISGSAVHAKIGAILFDTSTGALSYDADGAGKGLAVQFATLNGVHHVDNGDFFFG